MTNEQQEEYYAIIKYNIGKYKIMSGVKKSDFPNASTDEVLELIQECVKYDIMDLKNKIDSDEVR